MVNAAKFWRDLIATNNLPDLELGDTARANVGLLGHSIGGGLAAWVVDAAAKDEKPFTAAHVMAPQTSLVVDDFRYDSKANANKLLQGVKTEWGVQYGWINLLSPFCTVKAFWKWLGQRKAQPEKTEYELGTHLGFEDQLVVGRESFSTEVLPWLLSVLWGWLAVWAPGVSLRSLSMLRRDTAAMRAAAIAEPPAERGIPKAKQQSIDG